MLLRIILNILGDYGIVVPFSTIEQQRSGAIPNDVAMLDGPRFAALSETTDNAKFHEGRIKSITGSDPLSARFLHGEFFTFTPQVKLWLSVNHLPAVADDSHAFWRRIRQLPFTQTFPVNPRFPDTLMAEATGILAWMVRGCVRWHQEGLHTPAAVVNATNQYRESTDPLADFIREACNVSPGSEVGASDLYQHYTTWATKAGMSDRERLSATKFGARISERFVKGHTRFGKVYHGIARGTL